LHEARKGEEQISIKPKRIDKRMTGRIGQICEISDDQTRCSGKALGQASV